MNMDATCDFINEAGIFETLNRMQHADATAVREVLAKAREGKGLHQDEVATLMPISDPGLLAELFETARDIKERIYGHRLVLFAPLYISNLCANECLYCAFRARNTAVRRRALNQEEIMQETQILIDQGHKRVLMVAGESYPVEGFNYVLKSIDSIYKTRSGSAAIRRLNVNIAPLTLDEFRELKKTNIGTYQVFQETYHRGTYGAVHLSGHKTNYNWRITAPDRAMEAGIDDVGIGILFGLTDWRFEVLAMMQHIHHMEKAYGCGPHTVSVPRLEPATGSEVATHPPKPVSDVDFRKIVAILRLAVPYTGIIMSTRESPNMRRESFALGVSQISAGSRTNPGGYADGVGLEDGEQFSLGDHRSMDEVIRDVSSLGYIPSFCTSCYRMGRTGHDFMDLAKPGDIRYYCAPNALTTFLEYLLDYATPETRAIGEKLIADTLAKTGPEERAKCERQMARVRAGERDVYC